MNSEERLASEWCKDFIEVLIAERDKPFDSWATKIGIFIPARPNEIVHASESITFENVLNRIEDGENVMIEKPVRRTDEIIDFFYTKNVDGESKELYFSLTQKEYDVFKKADSRSPLLKINFLLAVRQKISLHKKIKSLEMSWVKSEMLNYTPTLEFKSESQINLLDKIIARIAALVENKKIQENFDELKHQKSIVRFDIKASKDYSDPIKGNATSADVIRYLLLVIEKFNPQYKTDRLSSMLWLNYLFLDVPGYSLAHIQKAPQRKS